MSRRFSEPGHWPFPIKERGLGWGKSCPDQDPAGGGQACRDDEACVGRTRRPRPEIPTQVRVALTPPLHFTSSALKVDSNLPTIVRT